MRPSLLLALPLCLLPLAACGGAVEPVPTPTPATSGTEATPPSSTGGRAGGEKKGAASGSGAAQCDGHPDCDPGDTKVSSESGCLNDGPTPARCYSREACGETIWCTGPACAEHPRPTCQPGWQQVETCPQDVACTTVTVCGQTISCVDLAAPPGGG